MESPRLLGTDRLSGMEQVRPFTSFIGDPFAEGLAKNRFHYLKQDGTAGFGIDTIVLLEERMDLRIRVEATLSHLFDREIILEWDSGNLIARARRLGDNVSYRLDRDECHGIKEILVLLTHLYDDEHQCLIIDEPELNLHPQYQAFFMQEVRKIAGNPGTDRKRKVVFLITHSPFMLDLRSEDDLNAIISFDLEYSVPKQVSNLGLHISSPSSFTRRLNAHHKQLFFADNPIFVEGIYDAWIVEAMMEARGVSVASAGSCIIDAGGAEEVDHYLKLCQGLGKDAHFLYDLDSLFGGNLRACVRDDLSIQSFLASVGLGSDFGKYCGQLEQELGHCIDCLLAASLPNDLSRLGEFLNGLGEKSEWKRDQWRKARTAVMTALSRYRENFASIVSEGLLETIEGRRDQIITALNTRNIHVLPGGTLERYLPHYTGNEYELTADAKREAVYAELEEMTNHRSEDALADRYGDLYIAVRSLPSKPDVDVDPVLRRRLSRYIHELQSIVVSNPGWDRDQVQARLNSDQPEVAKVFLLREFERSEGTGFRAVIRVVEMLTQDARIVRVDNRTNAGMGDFQIEIAQTVSEGTP